MLHVKKAQKIIPLVSLNMSWERNVHNMKEWSKGFVLKYHMTDVKKNRKILPFTLIIPLMYGGNFKFAETYVQLFF